MKKLPRVNVLWVVAPLAFALIILVLAYRQYSYYEDTVKPYARAQNETIGEFAAKLQEANYNTVYNSHYVYDQLKAFFTAEDAGNDTAAKQALTNIANFKSKPAVLPPVPPKHIEL